MKNRRHAIAVISLLLFGSAQALADDGVIEGELNAYWRSVEAYLAAGDFDGVVSTYHPDAVLVSESLGTSYPITRALERWKPGILETSAGKTFSSVEFQITNRLFSESTSHEKGIFHYRSGPTGESVDASDIGDAYIHFEALLLKSGEWTMVMEYQKQPATRDEWNAARATSNQH
ncbi:MAG: hypothetical protein ABR612_07380 [Chromatocurvus sp.]